MACIDLITIVNLSIHMAVCNCHACKIRNYQHKQIKVWESKQLKALN